MTKGTYRVNDDENPNKVQPQDTSYKSCICALLFVLVICVVILVATTIWGPGKSKTNTTPTFTGEHLPLGQENNNKNTTAKIIMQIETTTTKNYNNFDHGGLQTTTEKDRYTSATNATTPQSLNESSSVTISIKNESSSTDNDQTESSVSVSSKYPNSTSHPDVDIPSETPTENVEKTTTQKTESTSTDNDQTESSVSVSSKYPSSTSHPDVDIPSETPTENFEKTTTQKTESTSTDNDQTESSVSVSSKYPSSTSHPDVDIPSETPTENVEKSTTQKTESTSTDNDQTESSVSVSSKYQSSTSHPDVDIPSETPTENVEKSTTEETETTSTDNDQTESSVSVSSKYQSSTSHPDVDIPSETPTENVEKSTTEETETTSTDNDQTESSVSVSSKYPSSTSHPDVDIPSETQTANVVKTTTEENESSSTENIGSSLPSLLHQDDVQTLETTTATTVPDVIISRGSQSVSTNKPTTATSATAASTYSIDIETTTSTTAEDENRSGDIQNTPNDSSGNFDFLNAKPDPTTTTTTTTQISVQQVLNQQVVNTPDICLSAECKTVASHMLSLMDHSEDPCEDFYEFACGEMRAHDNDKDTWHRLSKEINLIDDEALPHFKALKSFYTSCVEHEKIFNYTDRILQVTALVKEIGWIVDSKADPRSVNLTSLFAKLILRQSLPIFDVEVDVDSQTETFILQLVPRQMHSMFAESGRWSELSESQIRCLIAERDALQSPKLDLNKIHLSYLNCQKDQEMYLDSVQSVVENLGLYSDTINWYNKSQLIKELRTTIEWKFLTFLEQLPASNIVREKLLFKKPNQYYDVMTVRNLQDKYPLVNWKILFEMITGNTIPYDAQIKTYFPDYIKDVFDELQRDKSSGPIDINNALISMYAHSLYQNLVIPQARHHREDYCLKLSTKLFQDVSNNLYVKTWKIADFVDYQNSSLEIFRQLKNKFKTEVETDAKWLDESSKQSLLRKLDSIKLIVTDEKDHYNYGGYLQQKYQIDFIKNNWPSNAVKMLTKYRKMLYSIQGSDFSTEKLWSFFINSYDSTPTSIYGLNMTVAPLGTMKKYIKNVPNYITMMKIGLPLAREIGHHFDHEGIVNRMNLFVKSFDYYNYMNYLMNNNTLNTTMLVGNQEITFDVEPQLSGNERIADNTALRLLSEIYNENDNPDLPWISTSYPKQKLFFILVAQEYCSRMSMPEFMQKLFESETLPPTLRVKNIVTNSEEFSETFKCSPTQEEIDGVSYKLQFPYLQNLDMEKYYKLLK